MSERAFKNLREVVAWLRADGWKAGQTTVYKHASQGKLKPEADGSFPIAGVRRYAAAHLVRTETLRHLGEDDLQRKKLMAEIAWKTEQAKREQIRRLAEEGKYYPRDEVDLMLAARGTALNAGLEYMFQTRAGDVVMAAGGDANRIEDVVHLLIEIKNELMNEFARAGREFHVVLKSDVDGITG